MRNTILLVSLLFVGCVGAIAQNKTLGVGTATPNPNAALHVESPTNNQGFIMPRLTTAQRAAMTGSLTTADIGLMVYDVDDLSVYTWEGLQWDEDQPLSATITTTTGNAGYFAINNPANAGAALYATTNGTGGSTSAAIVGETATAFSAITGRATGGAANAVSGISSDPGAGSFAILGSVSATGGGQAGVFSIANTANANNTLEASTLGTGGAGKFTVSNASSTKPALWAETNSNQPLSAPIFGLNTGTGDVAGSFRINNAANNFSALYSETNGTSGRGATIRKLGTGGGYGVYVETFGGSGMQVDNKTTGNGYAGIFQNWETSNTFAALFAEAAGDGPSVWALKSTDAVSGDALVAENWLPTGGAGRFELTDPANTSASIFTSTTGPGAGIIAENDGAANGFAGLFQVTQPTNSFPAIQATTKGTGSAIRAYYGPGDGTGPGVDVFMHNPSSGAHGVIVDQLGSGDAGNFNISNIANTNAALRATSNSSSNGQAFLAQHTGTGDAIFATANSGSGGNFQNTNASNTASTIFAMTNAPNGHAIGAINSAEGSAFTIFQGGMKLSTVEVFSGTTITSRAAAYRITGGGPAFTLGFSSDTGDMYMVFNDTAGAVTFAGVSIPAGEGKIVINFNSGSFRGL